MVPGLYANERTFPQYGWNIPAAIECLKFVKDIPDSANKWHKPLHELYRVALYAVSLSRYSRILPGDRDSAKVALGSKQLAEGLLKKIDPIFKAEFSRLDSLMWHKKAAGNVLAISAKLGIMKPVSDDFHGALGLLYLVNFLATEFGTDTILQPTCRDDRCRTWGHLNSATDIMNP